MIPEGTTDTIESFYYPIDVSDTYVVYTVYVGSRHVGRMAAVEQW